MNPTMQDVVRQWLIAMDYAHVTAEQLARAIVDHFDLSFKP